MIRRYAVPAPEEAASCLLNGDAPGPAITRIGLTNFRSNHRKALYFTYGRIRGGGPAVARSPFLLGLLIAGGALVAFAGWDRVMNGVYHFVVASRRERVRRLGDAMLDKVGAYLVGAVTIAFCAATTTFLWCVLMGLVGGALFGILGVLIAVPFYASLQMLVREVVFPRQDAR
jgi:predicted PurR-regulated permease PerM